MPTTAPYGSWSSPITADAVVAGSRRLGALWFDGDDLYWTEGRPDNGGRVTIVRLGPDGTRADVTPADVNVRTRVHEYGGGAYTVHQGVVYYASFPDGRVWSVRPGESPRPLTPEALPLRFADFRVDPIGRRLLAVCEDHTPQARRADVGATPAEGDPALDGPAVGRDPEPVGSIVAIPLDGSGRIETLVSGDDFYSHPRLSPDGTQLAWLSWSLPDMPWDQSQLWLADVNEDGSVSEHVLIAGGDGESITQPEWSPDGVLHFVSDRTGWWNLYRALTSGEDSEPVVEPVVVLEAELGEPQWVFGQSLYSFESPSRIIVTVIRDAQPHLMECRLPAAELTSLTTDYPNVAEVRATAGRIAILGGAPDRPAAILDWRLDATPQVLQTTSDTRLPEGLVSLPRPIDFPTAGAAIAHAFYYAPTNPDFQAPPGEAPPLLVKTHGGPTSSTSTSLSLSTQFWTSRGFAVVDVNYRGSTGYGTAYRRALDGQWGIADVEDVVAAVDYLVARGLADPDRVAIQGGSAGGYTTLAALTFTDRFRAGASHYGVADLEILARDTHKFESRYLDRLVAPYPEGRDAYLARSPIHHLDRLNAAIILLQGLEDRIVPPNQAQLMAAAARERGLPVSLVEFPDEGHGFRNAPNLKRALECELGFYARVFGFTPADALPDLEIANLP